MPETANPFASVGAWTGLLLLMLMVVVVVVRGSMYSTQEGSLAGSHACEFLAARRGKLM